MPEGSRLEEYLEHLPLVLKSNKAETIITYLTEIFTDCLKHTQQNLEALYPSITLSFFPSHEQFRIEEKRDSNRAITREPAKIQAYAYVRHSKLQARICLDLEYFVELLHHGAGTFAINLVETYVHEILHIVFPEKKEQKIHDLQCPLVEKFLGIELPKEIKKLRASDYYSRQKSENKQQ